MPDSERRHTSPSSRAHNSSLWHAPMPQSLPCGRAQNAEAIRDELSASERSVKSPSGSYRHLLVATSCFQMEVTQSSQVLCRACLPISQEHQILPL